MRVRPERLGVFLGVRDWPQISSDKLVPLTQIEIKNAKPRDKAYKLTDGGGLFLFVSPSGGKLWRLKYRHLGREKLLSLGPYPTVSLAQAREQREEAKKSIVAGGDPSLDKKRASVAATLSQATTFEAVAKEYIQKRDAEGVRGVTTGKAQWLIAQLGPDFGRRPISEIEPFEVLAALKAIERSGRLETARRCHSICGRVFRYAVSTARANRDPSADLKGALITPRPKHLAAILDPKRVGEMLCAIDAYSGQPATVWALKMAPHIFVRPGELRQAEWAEFDFENAIWRIPKERMKMGREHVAPLSRQVLEILAEAKALTGRGRYVFPALSNRQRPMCENTLNLALRRMGFAKGEMTSHGFRSTASTLLNESGKWNPDAIERALAHTGANETRAIYNRSQYWAERVEMAQWWSDYLDGLKALAQRASD